MANLNFITTQLATGGDLPLDNTLGGQELAEWLDLGITHVVDNRLEADDTDFVAELAPNVVYLHNGVDDAGQRMPDVWFDAGTAFVREAIAQPDAKVHVHCHMGINRGPSLAYACLLDQGWDPIEAIAAVRAARPIAGLGYAADALDWHHRRNGVPQLERRAQQRLLGDWFQANWIDVVRIIAEVRSSEVA